MELKHSFGEEKVHEATKMSGARLETLEQCYGLWK